jgi:hypothetical protein
VPALSVAGEDDRHRVPRDEPWSDADEMPAHRTHERRDGEAFARRKRKNHPALGLRQVDLEVHPVDPLDGERHVTGGPRSVLS